MRAPSDVAFTPTAKALLDAKDRRIAELEAKLLASSRRSAAPPRHEPG